MRDRRKSPNKSLREQIVSLFPHKHMTEQQPRLASLILALLLVLGVALSALGQPPLIHYIYESGFVWQRSWAGHRRSPTSRHPAARSRPPLRRISVEASKVSKREVALTPTCRDLAMTEEGL